MKGILKSCVLAAALALSCGAQAQEKPKGNIPSTPYRIGHMTFFTGPAAVLGEPMYKGQVLAAEEINAGGGLLGKRKIEVLKADEASRATSGEALMAFVAERVAPHKRIRHLEFIEAIPKSASGKILRRVLIDMEKQRAAPPR